MKKNFVLLWQAKVSEAKLKDVKELENENLHFWDC
jgi:hypothetical protein